MDRLAGLLVGQPLTILGVALIALAAYATVRLSGAPRHHRARRPLLLAGLGWLAYAGWEWCVLVLTPEANIRVDLLVIWPLMAGLSAWAILRLFR